jgi:hypothetical protein
MHLARMKCLALGLSMFLVACGSSSSSPTDPGNTGGTNPTIKTDPSFASDVYEILQRRSCTSAGCHGSGAGGLTMTTASVTYSNLVNQPAKGKTGETLVIPGDSANSYLVKKLEGASGIAGVQMPNGLPPLDTTDMTNIKNWIDQGAKNN